MTPTQLRCFATVVRTGSVRSAAHELGVTEAAVSGNVGSLRKEFDDQLFRRSRQGLVFTPGGIRLAHRASEMLGLQAQTRREIHDAGNGRRLLRIATTSLFAEFAAPGLIELFSQRADDLDVELLVEPSNRFDELLLTHGVDVAIGPTPSSTAKMELSRNEFLRYEVVAVCSPSLNYDSLQELTWFLGPSAVEPLGVSQFILDRANIPVSQQRIYTNHAAAISEASGGNGIALAPRFAVTKSLKDSSLVELSEPACRAAGTWSATTLRSDRCSKTAMEITRFVSTPRATQAMLNGSGAAVARFKPSVHITLWS